MMNNKTSAPRRLRFTAYIISVGIGIFAVLCSALVFGLAMRLIPLTEDCGKAFGLAAFAVGCLSGGVFIGRVRRHGGIAAGVSSAMLLLIPVTVGTLVFSGTSGFLPSMLGRTFVALICGAVGGIIGVNAT